MKPVLLPTCVIWLTTVTPWVATAAQQSREARPAPPDSGAGIHESTWSSRADETNPGDSPRAGEAPEATDSVELALPAPANEKGKAPRIPLLVDAFLVLRANSSHAVPQTWFSVTETGLLELGAILQPRPWHTYGSAVAFFAAEMEPTPGLTLRTLLDTGEIRTGESLEQPLDLTITTDGRPLDDGLPSLARVKELAVQIAWEHGALELGRRLNVVGDGLIFEDFATGAALSVALGGIGLTHCHVEAGAHLVGHELGQLRDGNLLIHGRVSYELSFFESIGLFGALLLDEGLLEDTLTSLLAERVLLDTGPLVAQMALSELFARDWQSNGRLGYVGVDAQLSPFVGLSVRGTAALSLGKIDIPGPNLDVDLTGWATHLDISYGINANLGVGTFAVAMSGDQPPSFRDGRQIDYNGFIAVAPYWTWTGLFFSGGLTQGLYPGKAVAGGVNGHGVVAGGLRSELSVGDLLAELRVVSLWATSSAPAAPSGGSGDHYGVETDLIVEWQLTDWLGLAVEVDTLIPGHFFPENDLVFRAIGQVHGQLGN